MGVVVQPHSSNGEVRAYTLNNGREETWAKLDKNASDKSGNTGILTLLTGYKMTIKWTEITFMRDLKDFEKATLT